MKEKILRITGIQQADFLWGISFAGIALLLGGAKIAGVFAPFCLAFCVAVPAPFTVFSFAGAIAGTLLFSGANAPIYLAALVIATAAKLLLRLRHPAVTSALAGASLALVNLFSMMIMPVGLGTWMLEATECLLCASLCFLFYAAIRGWNKPKHNAAELCGIGILAISMLLALCEFSFFGFNVGRFACALLVTAAAMLMGASASSVCGLLCAIALALCTKDFALIGGVLAVSGFLSGIFRPLGKPTQVIMMIGVFLLCSAFLGGLTLQNLIECIVASVAACFIPARWIPQFASETNVSTINDVHLTDDLALKLQFTARTLLDLQENVDECAKRMNQLTSSDMSAIYRQTADDVCRHCGLNTFCWVTAYNDTMRSINSVSEILRNSGSIHSDNIPAFFRQKCCKLPDFIQSINLGYRDFLSKEQAARRVGEARAIATEQFSGMSDLLMEMSEELSEVAQVDEQGISTVKNLLRDRGISSHGVSCLVDQFDRMTIDVYLDKEPFRQQVSSLTEAMSDALDREFERPSITQVKGQCKLSFFEAAILRVDFAAAQDPLNSNSCCGDSYDFFMDGKGFAHFILSDGMGSGNRAAIDSVMTCSTMRRLLQTGFGFGSAFKLMNLSFAIKSQDESLATVDICTVDLYTGQTNFVKAGAASSFICKSGHISELSSASLPIGIIQGIPYDQEEIRLSRNDMIVMLSDGATASGSEWVAAELNLLKGRSAKAIASSLLSSAKKRSIEGHGDDITVMVARLLPS